MRYRLVGTYLVLLALVLVGLEVPLAAYVAASRTEQTVLDRFVDAARFASQADPALRTNQWGALVHELNRYHELYGISVAVADRDGTVQQAVGDRAALTSPMVRSRIDQALAGERVGARGTVWPWQHGPLAVAVPVTAGGEVVGAVVTLSPTAGMRADVERAWMLLAGGGLAAGTVFVLFALTLVQWITRPVGELGAAAARLSAGALDARVPVGPGPVELRALAESFNRMADSVADALARQRAFVSQASHQLRNPLTALRLSVEELGEFIPAPSTAPGQDATSEAVVPGPAPAPGPEAVVPGPAPAPGPEAVVPGPEAVVPEPEAVGPGKTPEVVGPGPAPAPPVAAVGDLTPGGTAPRATAVAPGAAAGSGTTPRSTAPAESGAAPPSGAAAESGAAPPSGAAAESGVARPSGVAPVPGRANGHRPPIPVPVRPMTPPPGDRPAPDPSAGQQAHRLALEETDRLGRILDGLLALARAEGGRHVRESVDAATIADERAAAWQPMAEQRGIALTRVGSLSALVSAVPMAVGQVLDALIDNALKFAGRGATVQVDVRAFRTSVDLHVIDDGPGLSDEGRRLATERFWRAPGAQNVDGSGLGLPIVTALLEASQGHLDLLPASPHGLDARVRFPAVRPPR